jgi:hypothetical protein
MSTLPHNSQRSTEEQATGLSTSLGACGSRASAFYGPRPYPKSLAERPDNIHRGAVQEATRAAGIIPPQARVVNPARNPACDDCQAFTRAGGACPGAAGDPRTTPICLVDAAGRMASPIVYYDGRFGLAPGQERFYGLELLAQNVAAAVEVWQ